MHAVTLFVSSSPSLSQPKYMPRPVAEFAPSPWGDRFLNCTPVDIEAVNAQKAVANQLKEEIGELLRNSSGKPLMEQLDLIESIERLGVAYHFEKAIDEALLRIYEAEFEPASLNDLKLASLRFRLLRQHGYEVSSDLFNVFIESNGSLKKEVESDIHGLLSLYEACYARVHGEDLLDKALPLIISILAKTVFESETDTLLKECIRHALQIPLHKRVVRFDCVRYMQVYAQDLHNTSLLKFAKLDFNLLQALHKQELSELCRYWQNIKFPGKLPLRDRMVEGHAWTTGVYFEPEYSVGRKITSIGGHIIASIDDIYDAYATLEEAEIFTKAVERWDESCLEELPEDLKWFYKALILDAHEEFERLLAPTGRSHYVEYAKKEIKAVCQTYMKEARWRQKKYVPTFEEYKNLDLYRNTGYIGVMVYFFLGVETADDRHFQWICNLANPVKAICFHLRVLDDVGGYKFDENRGLSSLCIESYMKEHNISCEKACEELYMKADELWKDINQGMSEVSKQAYNTFINMGRVVEAFYNGGEDGYTLVNQNLKQIVNNMFLDSIPISM